MKYYSLKLENTIVEKEKISEALGIQPNIKESFWELEILEQNTDSAIDFITKFCELIRKNLTL